MSRAPAASSVAADVTVLASNVRRRRVLEGPRKSWPLVDLGLDVSAGDYPVVRKLYARGKSGERWTIPWSALDRGRFAANRVYALRAGYATPRTTDSEWGHDVLLLRDVLDAQVIDTRAKQVLRANDLVLTAKGETLELTAVDASAGAVLRRLTRGLVKRRSAAGLVDWRDVEFLRGDPRAAAAGLDYHRRVTKLSPAELARLSESLPYHHAAELLTLLSDNYAADVLEAMLPARRLQVFEELDDDQARRLLERMAPDRAADLVGQLTLGQARELLERAEPGASRKIVDLLRYPEDTAGGLMTNDVAVIEADITIGEAREHLRDRLNDPDFIYYIFVVDDLERRALRGVLTLRELIVADGSKRVSDVMHPDPETIGPLEPGKEAAYLLGDTNYAALPVVDADGALLGAITLDSAIAQIAPASWLRQAPRVFS